MSTLLRGSSFGFRYIHIVQATNIKYKDTLGCSLITEKSAAQAKMSIHSPIRPQSL